ncbi:MAG: septum formation inhibitor Maf [Syntrophomonadaceae bacterium]|nr:septum formation inhibitor Maf [Syntrophomonadaceae bacterium]
MRRIILASESPRRSCLLQSLGLKFEIYRPQLDEDGIRGDSPWQLVEKLARAKAQAVANEVSSGVIIAADTVVVLDNKVLGKPRDESEAAAMLARLSDRKHQVITGVCVIDQESGRLLTASEITRVYFRALSMEEIAAYVSTGEPLDKAGSYGIQGLGALLVERIEGCYYNVVGLPLFRLHLMLKEVGINILGA